MGSPPKRFSEVHSLVGWRRERFFRASGARNADFEAAYGAKLTQ
jgi:hypothetical protein